METLSSKLRRTGILPDCWVAGEDVKEFIKRLLWHTQAKTFIFSDKQNKLVNEWKESMTDIIKRLAGEELI